MDQSLNYTEMPSKEQVANDLDGFVMKKPRFNGLMKIGKTLLKKIIPSTGVPFSPRYNRNSKYEFLTVEHIFARCENEKMALKVEKLAQEHAKEKGWLILGSDVNEGMMSGNKNQNFVVYVTRHKDNLYACPGFGCNEVMTMDGIMTHRMVHKSVREACKVNELLKILGEDELDLNVMPKPVSNYLNYIF
jgi:hypothetical protein